MSCTGCATDARAKLTHDHSRLGDHHEDVTDNAAGFHAWTIDVTKVDLALMEATAIARAARSEPQEWR
jgi:fatty-acid desaturase